MTRRTVVIVLLIVVSQPSFSGIVEPKFNVESDSIPLLKEVQVTATRSETDILSTPYSVNTISRNDLDRFQYRTTPEAMMDAAGVFVQKTNHGGGSPFDAV